MNWSVEGSVWDPLERFLERAATLLPAFLAVLIVLIVGLVAAWLIAAGVRAALRALNFDRLGARPRVSDAMRRAGLWLPPSDLVAQVVRWVIVMITLAGALSILSTEATDAVIAAMVRYLPRLAAGLLIFVLGWAVSTFVARSVLLWAVNAQVRGARWLAGGAQLLVGVFFAALALENLGFGREIALTVLAILLGGGVLAAALAFGLAGQPLARRTLERMTQELREEDRDTISHL
ncbi:MAG: mechanosensitive ion channel family protein [Hyphomicrobiales bacterium]